MLLVADLYLVCAAEGAKDSFMESSSFNSVNGVIGWASSCGVVSCIRMESSGDALS